MIKPWGLKMAKFIAGMLLGLFLGGSATALAAGVFGDGYLSGWSVTKDGEEVCSDPSVSTGTKEIECD
jgi:hypothetical protein